MRPRIAFKALQILRGSYLHGPGTGITNLPSFSTTKFSLELVELPLASFFSTLMTSFLVGLSVRQTLPPVGESIGVVARRQGASVRLKVFVVVVECLCDKL